MPRRPYRHIALWLSLLLMAGPVVAAKPVTPAFAMQDLDGQLHRLSDYRGRWVILNFWATWCPPCQEELPELIDYHGTHPEDVLLGIDFEAIELKYLRAFVAETGIDFPVLPIGDHVLPGLEPINGLPTTIIIDPDGKLIAKHVGPVTRQMLEDFLASERRKAQPRQVVN